MPVCAACCHLCLAPYCVAGGPKCMSAIKNQMMHFRTRTGRATRYCQRRTKPLVRHAACISSFVVFTLLAFCSLRTVPPDFMEVTFELHRYTVLLSCTMHCSVECKRAIVVGSEPMQYDSAGAHRRLVNSLHKGQAITCSVPALMQRCEIFAGTGHKLQYN